MDNTSERPSAPFFSRLLRRIGDFEQAMDMRPIDFLELRVADLERRLAALGETSRSPAPIALASRQVREH